MAVTRRGESWVVSIYDPERKAKRYIATCRSREEGLAFEAAAIRGLPLPERDPLEGYDFGTTPVVYFAVAPDLGLVKIGHTTCLQTRWANLVTASPVELRLMHVVAGPSRVETDFHRRFRVYRVRGEWFRVSGALAEFLDQTFDSPRLRLVEGAA